MLGSPEFLERTALSKIRRFEGRFAVFAVLGLLFAQFGAVSHAYAHDVAVRSTVAGPAVTATHNACDDCLAFAPLLCAGPAAAVGLYLAPAGLEAAITADSGSLLDLSRHLAFRSRAPPPIAA